MPEPPSLVVDVSVTVPERSAPGLPIVAVGAVLSTRTVIGAEVKELPALSVVATRRSYWPSACAVVFQSAAWFVQVPAPIGERWNWTVATPEPPASAELLVRRDRAADVGGVGRSGDGAGRVGVVDAHGERGGGEGVAGEVGRDDAEVVLAVGLQGGVPAGGLVVQVPAPMGERWKVTASTPSPGRRSCSSGAIVPRTSARRRVRYRAVGRCCRRGR